jgi:transcriptional regulator with XRE-family HTH domain
VPDRSPISLALGAAVAALRDARGLSQEALAERCHMHRNYLGGIERGERNPTLEVLARLAAGLELKLSELLQQAEAHLT